MYNLNAVMLSGVLANDAELRYTPTGKAACFCIKHSRPGVKGFNFIDCVAWEKLAEAAGNLRKDDTVGIMGQLQTRTYEKDGSRRKVTEINVSQILCAADMGGGIDEDVPFDD